MSFFGFFGNIGIFFAGLGILLHGVAALKRADMLEKKTDI